MNILILYDTEIRAWLVNEPLESVEEFIKNGYPELMESWEAGTLKAEVIDVPDEDMFKVDSYRVIEGKVTKKIEGAK
ncbi:MAG: hypothetical protein DDT22_01136 [candidate division WS2 bacterium]|nr:hypothetical protein [Candidatus Lithacetigena glycinireducens]